MEFYSEPASEFQLFWSRHAPQIFDAYFWVLFLFGLGLSLYAFYRIRSFGYLLVAIYFCSPFISYGWREVSNWIHREERERILAHMLEEIEAMRERGEPIVVGRDVSFPVFETFLVSGLYFLAQSQIRSGGKPPKRGTK